MKRLLLWICALLAPLSAKAEDMGKPLYEHIEGAWSIAGYVSHRGNTIACRLMRAASDGSMFGYLFAFSAGKDGINSLAFFTISIEAPDNTPAMLTIAVDRKVNTHLPGIVAGGVLNAALPQEVFPLMQLIDGFKTGHMLNIGISIGGKLLKIESIDLSGSSKAFDENGICAATMMQVATERLKNTGNSDSQSIE